MRRKGSTCRVPHVLCLVGGPPSTCEGTEHSWHNSPLTGKGGGLSKWETYDLAISIKPMDEHESGIQRPVILRLGLTL